MKLAAVSAVQVGDLKEVRPDLFISNVTCDGAEVLQLGVPTRIYPDTDVRNNKQFKIFSLRLRLPAEDIAKLKLIDDAIRKEYPAYEYTAIIDEYDPARPRIEVRLDIDKANSFVRTLVFGTENTLLNPLSSDDLMAYMGDRALIDGKVAIECFVNPEKKTVKTILKTKALLCVSQGAQQAVRTLNPDRLHRGVTYPDGTTDILHPALCVKLGEAPAFTRKGTDIVCCVPSLVSENTAPGITISEEIIIDSTTKLCTRTGEAVNDIMGLKISDLDIYVVPLFKGDVLSWIATRIEMTGVSPVTYPSLKEWDRQVSFTGLGEKMFGYVTDGKGKRLTLNTGPVLDPETRSPYPGLTLLRVRLLEGWQREALSYLDENTRAMMPTPDYLYYPSVKDGCLELRLPKGCQVPSETNHVDILFTVEYNANPTTKRGQMIPRILAIHPLEKRDRYTTRLGADDVITTTPPRTIRDGSCFFGNFVLTDGSPIVLDMGILHYDSSVVTELASSVKVYKCFVNDDNSRKVLTAADDYVRENITSLAETTDSPNLNYYSCLRANDIVELRVDSRTTVGGGSIADSNSMRVQACLEYSILPLKERMQAIVRARDVQVLPRDEEWQPSRKSDDQVTSGMDVKEANDAGGITFESPPADSTARQKFVLFRYKGKPQSFRLEDMVLEKQEGQSVGLSSPDYEGNKLSVIVNGENLRFFRWLDEAIQSKIDDVTGLMELPTKEKKKTSFRSIIRDDNEAPVVKFTVALPDTTFYLGDQHHALTCATLDDVRPHVKLGTTIASPIISVSKVWYDKMKREVSVKLKLKSCVLHPRTFTSMSNLGFDMGEFKVGLA